MHHLKNQYCHYLNMPTVFIAAHMGSSENPVTRYISWGVQIKRLACFRMKRYTLALF